jgi:phosphoenolpyruvate phosphomutase
MMKLLRYLPRFRRAYKELEALAAREQWSRTDLQAFQLQRLNAVWAHAITHVPYYRWLATQKDLPPRFTSVQEFQATVPVLSKAVIRANPEDFLSEQAQRGHWTRTGGSTGTPMSCYWEQEAHLEMLRCRYRMQAQWGVDIFDRTAFIWGHSTTLKPGLPGLLARWRVPMEDWLRNRLRLSAYDMSRDALRRYLRLLAAFEPALIYGYSRALHLLAEEAQTCGWRSGGLKVIVLTGEPIFAHITAAVEHVFGAPAVGEYGAVECGFLAGEGPDRRLRVREDVAIVETVANDAGGFDLVITILNNPSFPLLRYAIADVTDAPLEMPSQGFAVLKSVSGRNNDLIVTRTGRRLHSARLDAFFKYENKHIRRFRVRQHADGALSVAVELDDPGSYLDAHTLECRLKELVEGQPIALQVVQAIPQTPAGKHRLVVSDLDVAGGRPALVHSGTNGTLRISTAHPPDLTPAGCSSSKATRLRSLVQGPQLAFLMEAHNGLSARIVEEAGFDGIWASGLAMSASLGVRDSNEASWTQVLEVLEFMSDCSHVPILVDGDTGYGNFNNMRRLVKKLEQHDIAGVCIEDKVFPKTNSFINGTAQPLADIDEFCGRIKAGKDAQRSDDFVIVARVEAFIAGWGLQEALTRAGAYHRAGADAILIHSARRSPDEILTFMEAWGNRLPVIIVPTKYYATPTDVFRKYGFSVVIWANHLLRSCITAMQRTAQEIFEAQSLVRVEDRIAPLAEVFRLQGASELEEAEKRYLPRHAAHTRAIILAASRGKQLGEMTADRPKCMVTVAGVPILAHIVNTYRSAGIRDVAVIRGYKKEAVDIQGVTYYDAEESLPAGQVHALASALPALEGRCLISHGDVLFKKYIPQELMEVDADFAVAVDANWQQSRNHNRFADYVTCSEENSQQSLCHTVRLVDVSDNLPAANIHGEWMGFLKVSEAGARVLQQLLADLMRDPAALQSMSMAGLLRALLAAGKEIRVIYTTGNWLDIDTVDDLLAAGSFQ